MIASIRSIFSAAAVLLLITACGGGGGSDAVTVTSEPEETATEQASSSTFTVELLAIDASHTLTGQAVTVQNLPIAGNTATMQ